MPRWWPAMSPSRCKSIVSRNITPFEPAVVTVGGIQAGQPPNIINDHVLMKPHGAHPQ